MGCKSDLENQVSEQLVRETYIGKNYFRTSAKNNEGVENAFETIEKDLVKTNIKSGINVQRSRLSKKQMQK